MATNLLAATLTVAFRILDRVLGTSVISLIFPVTATWVLQAGGTQTKSRRFSIAADKVSPAQAKEAFSLAVTFDPMKGIIEDPDKDIALGLIDDQGRMRPFNVLDQDLVFAGPTYFVGYCQIHSEALPIYVYGKFNVIRDETSGAPMFKPYVVVAAYDLDKMMADFRTIREDDPSYQFGVNLAYLRQSLAYMEEWVMNEKAPEKMLEDLSWLHNDIMAKEREAARKTAEAAKAIEEQKNQTFFAAPVETVRRPKPKVPEIPKAESPMERELNDRRHPAGTIISNEDEEGTPLDDPNPRIPVGAGAS